MKESILVKILKNVFQQYENRVSEIEELIDFSNGEIQNILGKCGIKFEVVDKKHVSNDDAGYVIVEFLLNDEEPCYLKFFMYSTSHNGIEYSYLPDVVYPKTKTVVYFD